MARRELSPEDEERLVAEIESRQPGEGAWDFSHPKRLDRGTSPTMVLSARVPFEYAKALRDIAAERHVTLSDVVKEALEAYAASHGPSVSEAGPRRLTLYGGAPSGPKTTQAEGQRFIDEGTSTDKAS
jgi:hypothetical protein